MIRTSTTIIRTAIRDLPSWKVPLRLSLRLFLRRMAISLPSHRASLAAHIVRDTEKSQGFRLEGAARYRATARGLMEVPRVVAMVESKSMAPLGTIWTGATYSR